MYPTQPYYDTSASVSKPNVMYATAPYYDYYRDQQPEYAEAFYTELFKRLYDLNDRVEKLELQYCGKVPVPNQQPTAIASSAVIKKLCPKLDIVLYLNIQRGIPEWLQFCLNRFKSDSNLKCRIETFSHSNVSQSPSLLLMAEKLSKFNSLVDRKTAELKIVVILKEFNNAYQSMEMRVDRSHSPIINEANIFNYLFTLLGIEPIPGEEQAKNSILIMDACRQRLLPSLLTGKEAALKETVIAVGDLLWDNSVRKNGAAWIFSHLLVSELRKRFPALDVSRLEAGLAAVGAGA